MKDADSRDIFLPLGALLALMAVAAGAFAAHGLRDQLTPRMLEVFQTGAHYQMYHALALVCVGLYSRLAGNSQATGVAGWAFVVGIVLFSGSLYALSISGIGALGMITPVGGLAFMVGWGALVVAGIGEVR